MKWDFSKLSVSGLLSLDWLFHGGELVFALVGAIVQTILGSPELVVAFVTSLNRLADLVSFIPKDAVNQALTVALVAMTALYAIRFLGKVGDNSES